MATDIRIDVDFYDHPKTIKLQRRFGADGVIALQRLWVFTARHKSNGVLSGMDNEEICIAMRWSGDVDTFITALADIGWIDETDKGYVIHDWVEHNPWAASASDRSDKSRFSKMASAFPDIYRQLREKGFDAISAEDYRELTKGNRVVLINNSNGSSKTQQPVNETSTNEQRTVNESLNDSLPIRSSPTPIPTPIPTRLKNNPPNPPTGVLADDQPKPVSETKTNGIPYVQIIDHLNHRTGKSFRPDNKKTQKRIKALWCMGFHLEDFIAVIDKKAAKWRGDVKMADFLRPETLFGEKFESYLNESQNPVAQRFSDTTAQNIVNIKAWMESKEHEEHTEIFEQHDTVGGIV